MTALLLVETSTSVLAAAITVHLAVLLLRSHRNPPGRRYDLLLLPASPLTASPWLFPHAGGMAIGLAGHLAWFVACDRLVPQTALAAVAAGAATAARPAAPAVSSASRTAPARTGPVKASVIGLVRETDDITTFRVTRPEGFDFKPGQLLAVRVTIDGKPVSRCYSVSSAPEATGYLEISVKRQGLVSGMLHATVRPGTLLETCEAAGVELPSACRAGVCGTCRCRLVDGEVGCDSDMLDDADRAHGYILPCVSWPTSDCAMEA